MAQVYKLQGLSTDTKPILSDMVSGSTFTELDTGNVYVYNSTQNNWLLQSTTTKVEATAVGIRDIRKTSTKDNVDTYTIYYTSGASTTFTVTNGLNGTAGKDGADGKDGTNVETGTGLHKTGDAIEIDDKIVATWEKLVANQSGDPNHVLSTIFLNDTLYYVGDGVGVGLEDVELSEDNTFIFTLADGTQLTCDASTMLNPLYERLTNISEELNGQFEALDAKLVDHEANIAIALTGVETLEGKVSDLQASALSLDEDGNLQIDNNIQARQITASQITASSLDLGQVNLTADYDTTIVSTGAFACLGEGAASSGYMAKFGTANKIAGDHLTNNSVSLKCYNTSASFPANTVATIYGTTAIVLDPGSSTFIGIAEGSNDVKSLFNFTVSKTDYFGSSGITNLLRVLNAPASGLVSISTTGCSFYANSKYSTEGPVELDISFRSGDVSGIGSIDK